MDYKKQSQSGKNSNCLGSLFAENLDHIFRYGQNFPICAIIGEKDSDSGDISDLESVRTKNDLRHSLITWP